MELLESLLTFNLDTATLDGILAEVQLLLDEQAELNAKDLKIQALILELAHLKRMRYGKKNEALAGICVDMFDDVTEDLSAIEAQIEQESCQQTQAQPRWSSTAPRPSATH